MTSLVVDATSPIPPYEQVRAQLAALIRSGELADNTRLPPVRQLAADLHLATGTVARAYRELEAEGLAHSRRGAGTRVTAPAGTTPPPAQLPDLARAFATKARQLGATDAQIIEALNTALNQS